MGLNAKTDIVFRGNYLHFCRTVSGWEFVRRPNDASGVTIVAVTDEAKLLLVEQRRPPLEKLVIELPAGLVDEAESEDAAVKRELEEETGYGCGSAQLVFTGTTSPGLSNEMNSVYLASELVRTDPAGHDVQLGNGVARHDRVRGKSDEGESIVVYEVPVGFLTQWLSQQQDSGKIIDLRVRIGAALANRVA
jgi:ADP-ribose pyrophosphatase